MTEKNFTQETLERIRSGKKSESSKKKRGMSKIILLLDGIIVVALLAYYFNREPGSLSHKSTSVTYKNVNMTYSVSRIQNEYIFSLKMKSKATTATTISFTNYAATLLIKYNDTLLVRKEIGKTKTVTIRPKGQKSIVVNVSAWEIQKRVPAAQLKKKPRKTLFSFGNPVIPLQTELTIHTKSPFELNLPLKHEVQYD